MDLKIMQYNAGMIYDISKYLPVKSFMKMACAMHLNKNRIDIYLKSQTVEDIFVNYMIPTFRMKWSKIKNVYIIPNWNRDGSGLNMRTYYKCYVSCGKYKRIYNTNNYFTTIIAMEQNIEVIKYLLNLHTLSETTIDNIMEIICDYPNTVTPTIVPQILKKYSPRFDAYISYTWQNMCGCANLPLWKKILNDNMTADTKITKLCVGRIGLRHTDNVFEFYSRFSINDLLAYSLTNYYGSNYILHCLDIPISIKKIIRKMQKYKLRFNEIKKFIEFIIVDKDIKLIKKQYRPVKY